MHSTDRAAVPLAGKQDTQAPLFLLVYHLAASSSHFPAQGSLSAKPL